ncbi:MAG: class II fructose-bisphosphate aldolase [Eubacteriales bacterium]
MIIELEQDQVTDVDSDQSDEVEQNQSEEADQNSSEEVVAGQSEEVEQDSSEEVVVGQSEEVEQDSSEEAEQELSEENGADSSDDGEDDLEKNTEEEITDNENTDEHEELENEEEGESEPLEELEVMALFSMQVYSAFGGGDGSEGNPYLISTLAQLKAIPNYTQDHFKITANINANNDWTTIGYFDGTLDGGNFTISNLNAPLFSQVGSSSSYSPIIKNLTVSCNMSVDTIRVGGITGEFSYGTIENCNSTGTISSNTSNARVGGIAGVLTSPGTIINCNNTATISTNGEKYVGGIVGSTSGTIDKCNNTGTISSDVGEVGGITGYNSRTVKNCSNTGAVSCTGGIAGGIAGGVSSSAQMVNCYNTATVTGVRAGGIAGSTGSASKIMNCYNAGTASGSQYVGGIAAFNFSDTTNCYWLTTTASAMAGWAGGTNENNFSYSYYGVFTTGGVSYSLVDVLNAWVKANGDYYYWTTTGSSNSRPIFTTTTPSQTALSNSMISAIDDQIYTGSAITLDDIVVTDGFVTLNKDIYTISYSSNINVGTATVTITANTGSNYTGSASATFTISQKTLTDTMVSTIEDQTYTSSPLTPEVVVTDSDRSVILVKNTDYTVTYSDHTDVGTATVTITGIGNYVGSASTTFAIKKTDSTGSVTSHNDGDTITYGSTVTITYKPSIQSTQSLYSLSPSDEGYVYLYYNGQAIASSKQKIAVTETASMTFEVNQTNFPTQSEFNGTTLRNFTIEWVGDSTYNSHETTLKLILAPKEITSATIVTTDSSATKVYDGDKNFTNVVIDISSHVNGDTVTATANGTSASANVGSPSFTASSVTLAGTHSGYYVYTTTMSTVTGNVGITAKSFSNNDITIADITPLEYTGNEIKPILTVKDGTILLILNEDYEITSYTSNTNVSTNTATVTITGIGNYQETKLKTFDITGKPIDANMFDLSKIIDTEYTGKPIEPNVTSDTLTSDDYDVTYTYNTDASTDTQKATVTITGIGNYKDDVITTFTVTAKPLTHADIVINSIADQVYTGSTVEPTVTVKDGTTTLILGTDYNISYSSNIDASTGVAKVIIKGIGNYQGETSQSFNITVKSLNHDDLSVTITPQEYTGNDIVLTSTSIRITDNGTLLELGTDYQIVGYTNHTDATTETDQATVIIEGIGNYQGTISQTFTILTMPLTDTQFDLTNVVDTVYTGSEIAPIISSTDPDFTYEVSYSSNIDTGKVTVTIEGTGNYSGSFTKTFNITVRILEESDFDNIGDIIYTGSEIEPDITSISLHSDTDYEITSYVDNVDVSTGIATVTIIGKANCIGTIEKTFNIIPPTITVTPIAGQTHEEGSMPTTITLRYNYTGAITGETPAFQGSLLANIEDTAGNYSITSGTLKLMDNMPFKASNYTLEVVTGVSYEVTAAPIIELAPSVNEELIAIEEEELAVINEDELVIIRAIEELTLNNEDELVVNIEEEQTASIDSDSILDVTNNDIENDYTVHLEENNSKNIFPSSMSVTGVVGTVAVAGIAIAGGVVAATFGVASATSGMASSGSAIGSLVSNTSSKVLNFKKIKVKRRKVFSEKVLLKNAKLFRYAVPQFNLDSYESVTNVLLEAKKNKSPVVISVNNLLNGSENQYEVLIDDMKAIMKENKIKSPVCIHLDGGNLEECAEAVSLGYSSVVYEVPANANLETQLKELKALSQLAKKKDSIVEVKIDPLDEYGNLSNTSAELCQKLVKSGVKSISLSTFTPESGETNALQNGTFDTLNKFKGAAKQLKFSLHNDEPFSQEELKKLIRLDVSKIVIEPTDASLKDANLLNKKLCKFQAVGKANNYLKIINTTYKVAKFIIKYI